MTSIAVSTNARETRVADPKVSIADMRAGIGSFPGMAGGVVAA